MGGDAGLRPGVVVVGAGPVGQTAALLLALRGVPVVLLDDRPARDVVGSRAIVQQRDVIDVWDVDRELDHGRTRLSLARSSIDQETVLSFVR